MPLPFHCSLTPPSYLCLARQWQVLLWAYLVGCLWSWLCITLTKPLCSKNNEVVNILRGFYCCSGLLSVIWLQEETKHTGSPLLVGEVLLHCKGTDQMAFKELSGWIQDIQQDGWAMGRWGFIFSRDQVQRVDRSQQCIRYWDKSSGAQIR